MTKTLFCILYVGVGQYRAEEPFGPTRFPHHDLFTVREGSAVLHVEKREFELTSGDAVLIPPGKSFHGTAGSAGCRLWVLHFSGYRPLLARSGFARHQAPLLIRNALHGEFERRTAVRLFELQGQSASRWRTAEMDGLARYLLAHVECISRQTPEPGGRWRQFEHLLAEVQSGPDGGTGVRGMAQAAGLSESYFRAQFKKLFSTNPSAALREIRLGEARRLLQETRMPIKEISAALGYSEISAFHRAFQRALGTTPAQTRRAAPPAI